MEFFERAHVSRKCMKKESKSEEAVKKQLKQLLNAYKKGNNQEIKSFGEKEIRYDTEDMKSLSEFSDFSVPKYFEISKKIESAPASDESHSNNEHNSSSYSNTSSKSDSVDEDIEESLESISENTKSPISSRDVSITEKESSFDSSILMEEYSDDTDISILSSLQSSESNYLSDDDDFDPDGALASKIMEKLNNKQISKKRRLIIEKDSDIKLQKEENKQFKKEKNRKTVNLKNKEPYRLPQIKEVDSSDSKEMNVSFLNDTSETDSCPYVSVSATDMPSQRLDDIVDDYIHSTVKNLPSQKQHIVHTPLNKYTILDEMISGEVAEDISSVIPEIDEELEELTLDSELPEIIADSTENDIQVDKSIILYNGRNNYIMVMKHPAELYIHGKVKVAALGGSVEVCGYTLDNQFVDVFAPYCYYAHCLKTLGKQNECPGLFGRLINAGLTSFEAEEIVSSITKNDAIISLSHLNDIKIDFIDSHFTSELFSRRNDQTPEFLRKIADDLGCSLYLDQPKKNFVEKVIWDEVVLCGMRSQSRGIICGGKGLGKSTFLRYYSNRLLASGPLLLIDLDPGQAELTMPGNISASVLNSPLIGPNFTHLRKPDRMLNIGMISTMDHPHRYISAVNQLITYCQDNEEYRSLPWIVNTMGMCNDVGLKFLTNIILQLKPTFLYQIDSNIPKKKFQFELRPHMVQYMYQHNINDRLLLNTHEPSDLDYAFIISKDEDTSHKWSSSGLSPKDERYLNVLAYFGQLVDIHRGKGILEIVPYEVKLEDFNIGVNVYIHQQNLAKVINGKIIALCQLPTADKGKVFNLRDNALLCHGYGLIRSVDYRQGLLYILTPVSIGNLRLVNTLVYTDWMPELHGLEKELPNGTIIPYRLSTLENPMVMPRPRRRFNPIQLLRATRNS